MGGSSSDSDGGGYQPKGKKDKGYKKEKMGKKNGGGGDLFNAYMAFRQQPAEETSFASQQQAESKDSMDTSRMDRNGDTDTHMEGGSSMGKKEEKKAMKKEKKDSKKMAKKALKAAKKQAKLALKMVETEEAKAKLEVIRLKKLPLYYDDDVSTEEIMADIAKARKWTSIQVASDMRSLVHNRLSTAGDLRALSAESWQIVELLPLVKDLIKKALDRRIDDGSGLDLECESSSSSSSSSSGEECEGVETEQALPSEVGSRRLNGLNGTGESAVPKMAKTSRGNRMTVKNDRDGKMYEVDRYCPHKGVDMMGKSQVRNGQLICLKHDWEFDLTGGGMCRKKGKSINAVCLGANPALQW
eukprot:comp19150_c0_seq1/m.21827 comp19150_c0_seq1/g.21827  ORF comp19150_c0_seq1/g.21827 comp19150_c0_seq1/m.21827 type:complete len:357 (-) comp19150_c0_seq1:601-1671(-)